MTDIDASRAQVRHAPITPEQQAAAVNAEAIRTALAQALANLQAIIDAPDPASGTMTTAQLSNHVRSLAQAVKTVARIERRLIRHGLADYSGTD